MRASLGVLGLVLLGVMGCGASTEDSTASGGQSAISSSYGEWKAVAVAHGVTPKSNQALVIGIRGRDSTGNVHPTTVVKTFNDTLIVLTTDQRVVTLPVSTHPWFTRPTSPSE